MPSLRRLNVFFHPPPPARVQDRTLVVIDTERATTSLVTLVAGGVEAVYPVAEESEARALAAAIPGAKLCGERNGDPIAGFDFGNSPLAFVEEDVRGLTFVQTTSNGTRALTLTRHADRTLVACLRNRAAIVEELAATKPVRPEALDSPTTPSPSILSLSKGDGISSASTDRHREPPSQPPDVAIVCAGEEQATAPSVEDAFTAGAIVAPLLDALPPDQLFLDSGARLALRVFDAYGRDPARAIADAPHADYLAYIGYQGDLDFSIELDAEDCVPVATVDEQGRVVVHR